MAESVVFEFTEAEKAEIQKHVAKYPDRKSAVMPALWIAQEKFGWLSPEAMELVASTLDMPYAQVYGVASFYTMYFKKKVPKYLFDICTCFTCGECGGDQIFKHAQNSLQVDENGHSADGKFWIRQAECLAACDTGPVMQIANRRIVHNLTPAKFDQTVDMLRRDQMPAFEPVAPKYDQASPAAKAAPEPEKVQETPPPAPEVISDSSEEE
ncbi:MAG: NAD(P)H-dependent oxidoreductase subunit E [Bacteroidia bacterium]|nr:NAD(P)H-dependent oxidoreductase subunit E [Bacteroidia bacterium]